jgi:hypothetical protein
MPVRLSNVDSYVNNRLILYIPYSVYIYKVDESMSGTIGQFMNEFDVNPGQDAILENTKIKSNISFERTGIWAGGDGWDVSKSGFSFSVDIECNHEEAISEIIREAYDFGELFAKARYEGRDETDNLLREAGLIT